MFTSSPQPQDNVILKELSTAYKAYKLQNWNYPILDRIGTFLIERCVDDAQRLKYIATIIGKGLLAEKEDAKNASLLFEKVYKDGFAGGLLKDSLRNRFNEILPEKSIERLNGGTPMSDCMKSICIYEQSMSYKK